MIKRCQMHLGTFVEISIFDDEEIVDNLIDQAFALIKEIENHLSFFDHKSDLFLVNQQAFDQETKVSKHLITVLKFAKKLHQITGGVFDVTKHRSSFKASMKDVILTDSSVRFLSPLQIDLAGIAKGYVVDCVAELLKEKQISNFIVNAGGDLCVGDVKHQISIRNPLNPNAAFHNVMISDCALASSSGYFDDRATDELSQKKYPLFLTDLDVKNSELTEEKKFANFSQKSVSVFASDCMTADALTKVVLILEDKSQQILQYFSAQAMICSAENLEDIKFLF